MSSWLVERRKLPWVTLTASEEEECRLWSAYEAAQAAASKAADARHEAFVAYYRGTRSDTAFKRLRVAQTKSEKADAKTEAAWDAWHKYTSARSGR